MTARLEDIFLSAWLNYMMYKFLVFGHVVGLGILVLDALFAPQPIGQGARPLANTANTLVMGLLFSAIEMYQAYIWLGATPGGGYM